MLLLKNGTLKISGWFCLIIKLRLVPSINQKAPFINTAAYQIQDKTGSVWVVTQQTPPAIEQKIAIKGKIQYQSLPLAQQELGDFYIQELEQSLTIEELK